MYGKIFEQMFDGTLATQGPWQALVTFQQLIILADSTGCVDMTPEAISRRTTIPLEIIVTGLQTLTEPDPKSRTPTEDGRRIVRLNPERDWGWRLVNYEHYRKIRSEEERREYHRRYYREKRRVKSQQISTSQHLSTDSTQAVSSKQYAIKRKEGKNGSAKASPDITPVIAKLPLRSGLEFEVHQSLVVEFEAIYPAVDVSRTLQEMRGWCLGNPGRLKTPHGIRRFINNWLREEQEKHGG